MTEINEPNLNPILHQILYFEDLNPIKESFNSNLNHVPTTENPSLTVINNQRPRHIYCKNIIICIDSNAPGNTIKKIYSKKRAGPKIYPQRTSALEDYSCEVIPSKTPQGFPNSSKGWGDSSHWGESEILLRQGING